MKENDVIVLRLRMQPFKTHFTQTEIVGEWTFQKQIIHIAKKGKLMFF